LLWIKALVLRFGRAHQGPRWLIQHSVCGYPRDYIRGFSNGGSPTGGFSAGGGISSGGAGFGGSRRGGLSGTGSRFGGSSVGGSFVGSCFTWIDVDIV